MQLMFIDTNTDKNEFQCSYFKQLRSQSKQLDIIDFFKTPLELKMENLQHVMIYLQMKN